MDHRRRFLTLLCSIPSWSLSRRCSGLKYNWTLRIVKCGSSGAHGVRDQRRGRRMITASNDRLFAPQSRWLIYRQIILRTLQINREALQWVGQRSVQSGRSLVRWLASHASRLMNNVIKLQKAQMISPPPNAVLTWWCSCCTHGPVFA